MLDELVFGPHPDTLLLRGRVSQADEPLVELGVVDVLVVVGINWDAEWIVGGHENAPPCRREAFLTSVSVFAAGASRAEGPGYAGCSWMAMRAGDRASETTPQTIT